MKIEPKPSDREVLAGLVERVTYQNAESGFCVVRQGIRYGKCFASQKCGGAKVTIRSLLLCGGRDIDIHRLRDWHGLAIASGPQALKLVKRFVETSLKSGFVTGELTKCIALFRVSIERASKEDFFPVAF